MESHLHSPVRGDPKLCTTVEEIFHRVVVEHSVWDFHIFTTFSTRHAFLLFIGQVGFIQSRYPPLYIVG